MPSLHELQRAFGGALLLGDSAEIEPFVLANGVPACARVRIYRNNTRENFLAALRAGFPVLERLVGEDYFRHMAFDYRARFPSPSGNLHHVGEQLPVYLARRYAAGEYAYFADVARLEWAYQEVLVAADHSPLQLDRLHGVAPESYAQLVFKLHPAARLIASSFPVWSIWKANQRENDAEEPIDLGQGGEQVLLLRTREGVELRNIDAADFAFLSALAQTQTLTAAIAAAARADGTRHRAHQPASFDIGATLRRHVAAGAIVDFALPEHSRPET